MTMTVDLAGSIVGDGHVALEWAPQKGSFNSYWLLAIRCGANPGFTTLKLDGKTFGYRFANLGRHQRYRFAVVAVRDGRQVCSRWVSATPRKGDRVVADADDALPAHLAPLARLVVMPQDRRLTLYWKVGAGFIDKIAVELRRDDAVLATYELEPEVRSFTIDAARCSALANGRPVTITAHARFGLIASDTRVVTCTPAPQGGEREANRTHDQQHLVYPCLSLAPEMDVFGDGDVPAVDSVVVLCGRCRGKTEWRDYALRCKSCRAEFIGNQRGDYLDIARLRFGTCQCCLPRKLLVQDAGIEALRCAHSGKEHIRTSGQSTFMLIEDLPFGLCQCCRPRRPLLRLTDDTIRCSKSNELHQRTEGQDRAFVLVPSAPIFDAAAIDELLDAGLADICAGGVTRGRRHGGKKQ